MSAHPAAGAGPSVVVLGAGLAGLAAGFRLRNRGFDVTVLEAADAPGGRARGIALSGSELDPCANLVSTSDAALRSLLDALGQPDELEAWPDASLLRAHGDGSLQVLSGDRPRWRRPPVGVRKREALRTVRLDRLVDRYARTLDPALPERATVLDDRSVAEWTRLYFGEGVLDAWVSPWLAAATLGDCTETTRVLFLRRHATGRRAQPASLRAGPGTLAESLARRVPTRLGGRRVMKTRRGDGFEIEARTSSGATAGTQLRFAAEAVVLALPPRIARCVANDVLTQADRDPLAEVRFRPALSVSFVTRHGDVPPARRIVVTDPRRALRALQFQGAVQPRASACVVAVASESFARDHADAADDIVVRRLLAEAEAFAPAPLREIQATCVSRYPEALPAFQVGAYRAVAQLRKAERLGFASGRRLAHAGDHLLGPRLEDAIASGLRAAESIEASFR